MRRTATLLFLIGFAPAIASAQDDDARFAQARARFAEAEAAFSAEDYDAALAAFDESYELMAGHPNQGMLLYNSALCHDRLRHYAQALELYRQFLIEAPDEASHRNDARRRAQELEPVVEAGVGEPPPDPEAAAAAARPPAESDGGARTEGSLANWLIAGGLVALAIPALAIPSWTLATEGECVDSNELGCRERVEFGVSDGVLFGLAGAALIGAVIFAAAQPIQVEVSASSDGAYLGVRGAF